MDFTCVEIKNVKYIKLINLDRKCEKEIDLTTIHRDQELAFLNIFYVDDNKKKQILKSIQVDHIRPGQSGIPELHLFVQYDGKRFYKILLKLNGYIYHNSVVDIKPFRKRAFPLGPVLLASAALAAVGFLLYFGINTFMDRSGSESGRNFQVSLTGKGAEGDSSRGNGQAESPSPESGAAGTTDSRQSDSDRMREPESPPPADKGSAAQEEPSESSGSQEPAPESGEGDGGIGSAETEEAVAEASREESPEPTPEVRLETKPESVLVDDEATVYFHPNSTVLTPDTISVLDQILVILKNNGDLDVDITGHCAFYGTEKGRQEISIERAENVYRYFISGGWKPERKPLLAGRGHLDIVTRDPDKQNLNRRVEIIIRSRVEE